MPPRASITVWASFLVTLLVASTAQAAPKRVGVPKFEGPTELLVRKKVMKVLKAHGFEMAKSREVEGALSSTGAILESDDGFQKVARELGLSAIVYAGCGKKKAKIAVHDGRDGSVLAVAMFNAPSPRALGATVARDFWKRFGPALARAQAPAGAKKPQKAVAAAPEDDENAPDEADGSDSGSDSEPVAESRGSGRRSRGESASEGGGGDSTTVSRKRSREKAADASDGGDEGGGGPIPPTFDLAVGPRGISRSFDYNQSLAGLRPYNLPMGPALGANFVWYSKGGLGVEATVEQGFAITSSVTPDATFATGGTFSTSVHEYAGGVRYRMPFGDKHQVFFSGTGGEHAFLFRTTDPVAAPRANLDIPDTIYRYLRVGSGVRFELGDVALGFAAGYRVVLNGGGSHVKEYFPHRSVGGMDLSATVGYHLTQELELRAVADYRRYFYDMNSKTGDDYLAGGALDQYFTLSAGIAWVFGGGYVSNDDSGPRPARRAAAKPSEDDGDKEDEKDEE